MTYNVLMGMLNPTHLLSDQFPRPPEWPGTRISNHPGFCCSRRWRWR